MNKKEDSQQKTLFQCWNKKPDKQEQKSISNLPSNNNSKKRDSDEIILLDESDASFNQKTNNFENQDEDDFNANDLELIKASETMLTDKSRNSFANNATIASTSRAESSLLDSTTNRSSAQEQLLTVIDHGLYSSTTNTDTTGFDHNAGSVWIYPNNMPIRAYQYNIIQQCLYNNTMVVLPTGLGKTFVAAVVMLNFYRWYPNGKIIFMAPTKPLVNQQSDACCKIVGITKTDMCQLTGQMNPDKRKALWTNKRVFFLTPQVISNDILRGNVDVSMIKLVVIDEAHKALGEYAFCKVIESINETNKNFRVLALTATPGSDAKTVQGIINSLLISHIELRSDDSIDIQQYNHGRQVAKFILKLEEEILQIKNAYLNVMKSPLKRLEINRIVTNKDPNSLSKLFILDRRDQFRKNPPSGLDQKKCGFIESDFALLISMIHALELLTQYGVKSFYMFIKSFIENTDNSKSSAQQTKFKNEIMANDEMAQWFNKFKESFDNKASIVPKELRHPKLIKLEEVIIEHFNKFDKNNTRVMIFSQYRESVYEITEMLAAHSEIKAMEFVGQSGVNGTHKTVTQKEQLEVVKKFRDGGYNTLVSTCVGEEGLDIGEVDLIICYDSQKSPIRLIQRMGRTGRKREGRIVILLTEGKEVASYECSLSKKKNIYRVIQNGAKNFKFYQNNPLMIPRNIRPTCHKIFISAPISDNEDETSSKKKSKKKSLDYDNQDEDDDGNDEENLNKTKKTANRKSKTISTDNESGSENKPVQKRKRQSKNTTKLDDPESKVTKRKNAKKSTLITSELSNDGFSTQGPTQLPELDLRFSTDTVTKNVDFNLDNEEEEDDEDLKFLKNTNSNLLDVMSTSITSNKSLNDSKNSKNSQTESNKNSNDIEQMIIDETVAFITEESNESSSRKSASPLAISNPNRFAATIEESMLITQKSNINETNENNKPKLVIEDTFAMSCNSSSSSAKSTSTIDQIIDDVINQAEMEKDKENSLETIKTTEPAKFNLIDKRFSHLKKSPIGEQNSTSTPMRSILKNKTPLLNNINENNISYSPLILSQAITEQNTKLNKESNLSMIGMTQALDILSTCPVTPKSKITINSTSELGALPFKFYFKSPDIISFEMKTDLLDLFKEESDESKLHNNSVRFSSVKVKNALNQESIICIDSNMDTDLKDSKKRLRFDESPQKNDQYDVPIDDESIIQMKRKKIKRNVLNDSAESLNANDNYEKEYNEAIGNDYMQKYADDFESESDEAEEDREEEDDESESSELDTRDIDYKKKKRKREMKKASKFVDQEAELSSCDDCEVSEDEIDEDDEYDLKDSMIDRNHYSHDESAMALYHKSLKNVQFTKEYLNRPMRPITDDIFSQAISQTEPSQYVYDSFCVPETDEIVYEKKSKKKKKKEKQKEDAREVNKKSSKLRRLKFLEESQAPDSLICLSSSDEAEKQKLGNSSYEIFGTNPNEKKKSKKVINSITEEEEDEDENDDDLLLAEAEANLSRSRNTPSKSMVSPGDDVVSEIKSDFAPEIDSESEDFNNWLSNDIEKSKEQEGSNAKNKSVFSIFNKPVQPKETNQKPVVVAVPNAPVQIIKNSNWLILDTSLLASAADVVQNLKKIWDHDKLIIHSSINCDFVVSQRYALLRFKWSDISAPSNREHVIERLKKARSLYSTVMLLVQDDRETNLIKTRSKYFDSMLANLTEASFILFSKFKSDEICNQINYLSKTESTLGFGIEFDCAKIIETKKRDINFYLSLPNISIINALYACNNYETIFRFLNSSIQDLVLKLKINDKKAKQLLRFLNLSESL